MVLGLRLVFSCASGTQVLVDVEPRPFAEGSLRRAHKMYEIDDQGGRIAYVAKFSKVFALSLTFSSSVRSWVIIFINMLMPAS
jgi:hypothetical protein